MVLEMPKWFLVTFDAVFYFWQQKEAGSAQLFAPNCPRVCETLLQLGEHLVKASIIFGCWGVTFLYRSGQVVWGCLLELLEGQFTGLTAWWKIWWVCCSPEGPWCRTGITGPFFRFSVTGWAQPWCQFQSSITFSCWCLFDKTFPSSDASLQDSVMLMAERVFLLPFSPTGLTPLTFDQTLYLLMYNVCSVSWIRLVNLLPSLAFFSPRI